MNSISFIGLSGGSWRGVAGAAVMAIMAITSGAGQGVLAGCSASGNTRAGWTRNEVTSAKQSAIDLQNQLTKAVDALGELTNRPEPDLKDKFWRFSGELDRAQSQASRTRGAVVGVQTQGEKYFSQWDAEIAAIGNAEIKARSQARRASSLANFRAFAGEHDAAREAVSTLLASMGDIRKHLSADMTPAGVDAIRDIADRTRVQLSEALQRLGSVAGQLDRIDADLSPGMISADMGGATGEAGAASSSTATVDTTK